MFYFSLLLSQYLNSLAHMHLHRSTSQFTCNGCFAEKPYSERAESSSRNKQQIRTDFWKNGIKSSMFWYGDDMRVVNRRTCSLFSQPFSGNWVLLFWIRAGVFDSHTKSEFWVVCEKVMETSRKRMPGYTVPSGETWDGHSSFLSHAQRTSSKISQVSM